MNLTTGLALGLLLWGVAGVAQDLSVPAPNWVHAEDNPDTLPDRGEPALRTGMPAGLSSFERPTFARVRELINEKGTTVSKKVLSELPWLEPAATAAFLEVSRPKPARRGGEPVAAEIEYFLVFNPCNAPKRGRNAAVRLVQPVSVPFPGAAKEARHAFIEFEFAVGANGEVTSIRPVQSETAPALVTAVEATLPRWKFAAARADGSPRASTVVVPVLFVSEPPEAADGEGMVPVQIIHRRPPNYPEAARRLGAPGRVVMAGTVDVEGRVRDLFVLSSSHRLFEEAAIKAISEWRFRPALRDGVPVSSHFVQPLHFSIEGGDDMPGALTVKRDAEKMARLPPELQWDEPPQYMDTTTAPYPFEALAAGETGHAQLAFVVGPDGRVVESKVVEATAPEFGGAAVALLDTFRFIPASKKGRPSAALLGLKVEFGRETNALVTRDEDTVAIARRLKDDRGSFARAREVDGGLVPRHRPPPRVPRAKKSEPDGEAVVEFVIARDGRVHAPRIVSATAPEFGFSAAQAISEWRFAPPKREGKPVDVIARMPVRFKRGD